MCATATRPEFEALIAEHAGMIRRIAAAHEVCPHLREDLVQEIVLALWQALPNYRGEAGLRTFVARVAQNRAIGHAAREARRPKAAALDEGHAEETPSPEQATDAQMRRWMLERTVRSLPVGQREIIALALEGFSHAEIAETLGIGVNAATVRYHRAKAALIARMKEGR